MLKTYSVISLLCNTCFRTVIVKRITYAQFDELSEDHCLQMKHEEKYRN